MVLEIDALWLTLHSYFVWTITFDTWLIHWNVSQSASQNKHNITEFYIL